jgi:hypothetical protein
MTKSLVPVMVATGAMLVGAIAMADADQSNLVPNTEISGPALTFDWPAIEIGVGSYEEGPTGLTIISFPKRATVAVDVRGVGLEP